MNPPYRARDRPLPADTPWLNNTLTLRKEIKGLEDDEYTVTEIKTADGYTLLKKGIAVVISRKDASASAAVDGKQAAMLADNGSANALVPLSVVNTSGFDLPATGDRGVWMYGLAGILLMTASAACIIIARKRFK